MRPTIRTAWRPCSPRTQRGRLGRATGRSISGATKGREAIRAFFAGASNDLGPMTLHYLLAPRIELAEDGVSATGVCYLLAILDQRPASSPPGSADRERVLLGGVYAHRFQRVDGRWLISGSSLRPQPRGAAQECDLTALSRKTESRTSSAQLDYFAEKARELRA